MSITVDHTEFQPDLNGQTFWQNRPWGAYQSLTELNRCKVRHLVIRPGKSIGLQSHFHRAEHWVVVAGSGRFTIGPNVKDIFENQSVDIPVGIAHQMENHGKVDLHLIEVQTGPYLGEDDILRLDDCAAA